MSALKTDDLHMRTRPEDKKRIEADAGELGMKTGPYIMSLWEHMRLDFREKMKHLIKKA